MMPPMSDAWHKSRKQVGPVEYLGVGGVVVVVVAGEGIVGGGEAVVVAAV